MKKHDFITLYQGADYYGLGLKVFTRMARETGSVYKIGKKAAGDIADRSLANYMPHMNSMNVSGTEISGGQITATVVGADEKETALTMYSVAQFEKPDVPHSVVTDLDGSQWYQMARYCRRRCNSYDP